ncbi:MAG: hypothetical protein U0229_15315 [Anaeromyxobacter sp.]
MRIADSSVAMASRFTAERTTAHTEQLEVWVGPRAGPAATPAPQAPPPPPADGEAMAAGDATAEPQAASPRDQVDLEILRRTFRLARHLTQGADEIRRAYADEAGTARAARELGERKQAAATPREAGWGLAYDSTTVTTEREAVSFSAAAHVTTADGRTIDAAVSLALSHEETHVETVSLRAGDAKRVDPLVLDLAGAPAALDGRMSLDLDGDGEAETTAAPGAGGAFLARDLDGNGKVDSGVELFGPSSGDGFAELAALDRDGNGWVDEADAGFRTLSLWSPGGALTPLSAAGVGALYTGAHATPFVVKGGAMTATGLYLREDGAAGTIRHVDLDV